MLARTCFALGCWHSNFKEYSRFALKQTLTVRLGCALRSVKLKKFQGISWVATHPFATKSPFGLRGSAHGLFSRILRRLFKKFEEFLGFYGLARRDFTFVGRIGASFARESLKELNLYYNIMNLTFFLLSQEILKLCCHPSESRIFIK